MKGAGMHNASYFQGYRKRIGFLTDRMVTSYTLYGLIGISASISESLLCEKECRIF